jgi:hypothetical protein
MEISNSVGGTLEELLRHHPELASPCILALLNELKLIIAIADGYQGLTMEDGVSNHPEAPNTNFTTILHFAKGILNCFDTILTKKEAVTLFLQQDGVAALTRLLRVAHKPARYVVASFSCSTDPSTHSLGHYPVVKVCLLPFPHRCDTFCRRSQNVLDYSLIKTPNSSLQN